MGKGDRKGKFKPFPEVAAIPHRKARGRQRMAQIRDKPDTAAMQTVLTARKARGAPDDDAARDPLHGSDIGRCIMHMIGKDDRREVSDAWASLSSAWANYCARILGIQQGPQCATITMTPEPMQTDPSLRVDTRTPAEKDMAAKRAYETWTARIAALPTPMHAWAIRGALHGFTGDGALWHDCKPTSKGRVAVAALRMLAKGR